MGIPMMKIRLSHDHLIFIIEISCLERWSLYWNGALIGCLHRGLVQQALIWGYIVMGKSASLIITTDQYNAVLHTAQWKSFPPGQNGRHFTDDLFRCNFINEKFCILIQISLKFAPNAQSLGNVRCGHTPFILFIRPTDNNSALV